jgi:hypothetical protein
MQIEKNAKLEGQNGTLGSNKMEVEAPNKTLKKEEEILSKKEGNGLCCASYISL